MTVEQKTPELSDVVELPPPSLSANSPFNSTFEKMVKIESGGTTPLPDASPPHSPTILPAVQAAIEWTASQTSSGGSSPSTTASEDLVEGAEGHSNDNTPDGSEGDTEVESLDAIQEAEQSLGLAASQSPTPRPGLQHKFDTHSLTAVAAAATRRLSTPVIYHGLPVHHRHSQLDAVAAAEQQTAVGSAYVEPTDTYIHHIVDNNIGVQLRQGYTNSATNTPPTKISSPTIYAPFQRQETNNHSIISPPNPTIATSAGPSHLAGYPSGNSSDFNGAMPVDPDWHNVDQYWGYIRDGTWQQSRANGVSAMNTQAQQMNQQADSQKGLGGYWATEYDAMANDPRRFASMQSPQNMVTTLGTTTSVQQQQQPQPMGSAGEGQKHGGVAMQRHGGAYGYSSLGGRG